jgi:2-amino-4-hydroxy-6-hydroxymethyldihydropteridine diphosphokinase
MPEIDRPVEKNRAVISLGSNVNKEENLPEAVSQLARMCTLVSVSSVFETMPVGSEDQPVFWNAAALIETELSPSQLKKLVLVTIENNLGRVRLVDKNAPRTIDADLTLYNQEIIHLDTGRSIPDPDLLRFAHVALPVAELLPDEPHPVTGKPFAQIAEDLISLQEINLGTLPRKVKDVDLKRLAKRIKKGLPNKSTRS